MTRRGTSEEGLDLFSEDGGGADGGPNLLLFVHQRLRGRYWIAAIAGAILTVAGAAAGHRSSSPAYTSTGIIRVAPTLSKILYQTEENEVPPLYESFVAAQASFVRSRRVLDRAVEDEALQEAGWPSGGAGVARLMDALSVSHRRRHELISVSVTHPNPTLAQHAVNAVLRAYQELYGERSGLVVTEKERILEERQRELQRELETVRENVFQLADEFGVETVERLHGAQIEQLEDVNARLAQVDLALAEAESRASEGEAGASPEAGSPEALSLLDAELAGLMASRRDLQGEYDRLSEKYGPKHRAMRDLRERIETLDRRIAKRADAVRGLLEEGADLGSAMASAGGSSSAAELRAMRDRYEAMRQRATEQISQLGRKLLSIESLREREAAIKESLDATATRLEQIRVETQNNATGRVSVAQMGDRPVRPSRDRRKAVAALGGCVGFCAGVGLVFLASLPRRGLRYIDEIDGGLFDASLLGTLPDLGKGDPEHNEMAALGIHHLRNVLQLQLKGDGKGCPVLCVTSAAAGDGKTSLSIALGMSFAVAGWKTLLIDMDLVGRGLTNELDLPPGPGVSEAIQGGSTPAPRETRAAGLWAISAGEGDPVEARSISHERFQRLLESVRSDFDVVIVDSGPLLGSLEASVAAAHCDQVVLAVSRGQTRQMVAASLGRLEQLGAVCAGLVFNKADHADFDRSVSRASLCSASFRSGSDSMGARDVERRRNRGLLARAVADVEVESAGAAGAPGVDGEEG